MIVTYGDYTLEGEEDNVNKFVTTYLSMYKQTLEIDISITTILDTLSAENALDIAGKDFNIEIRSKYNEC